MKIEELFFLVIISIIFIFSYNFEYWREYYDEEFAGTALREG